MESHKERMRRLRDEDPIHYYELMSNPTGCDSKGIGAGGAMVVFILFGALCWFICSLGNV